MNQPLPVQVLGNEMVATVTPYKPQIVAVCIESQKENFGWIERDSAFQAREARITERIAVEEPTSQYWQ
jgi:hypothetical protein